MKLKTYLKKHKLNLSAFARLAGLPVVNVWRYNQGDTPSLLNMRYIKEATNGEVTEADFTPKPRRKMK